MENKPSATQEQVKMAMYAPGIDGNTGTSLRRISILTEEIYRLRDVLANEVKHHVAKVEALADNEGPVRKP